MNKRRLIVALLLPATLLSLLLLVARVGVYRWGTRSANDIFTLNGDPSMEPYIGSRVYFVADRNAYRIQGPLRWDAVVFDEKASSTASALWVIGLPGEMLSISKGQLQVNNRQLDVQPKQLDLTGGEHWATYANGEIQFPFSVPNDSYVLLGGNVTGAKDSRHLSVVNASRIVARVNR